MHLVCQTEDTCNGRHVQHKTIGHGVQPMVFEDIRKIPLYGLPLIQRDTHVSCAHSLS